MRQKPYVKWLAVVAWLVLGYFFAQLVVGIIVEVLVAGGFKPKKDDLVIFQLAITVIADLLIVGFVIWLPKILFHIKTTKAELGLTRLPAWKDLLFAPLGAVLYFPLAILSTALSVWLIPGFDAAQKQDIGFSTLSTPVESIMAFFLLVIFAPVVEELIFRGWLYGKLHKYKMPGILLVIVISALFGIAHGQLNVAVNVAMMSVVACWLRYQTGSIWAGILLHMLKNGFAYYFLFVNPIIGQ